MKLLKKVVLMAILLSLTPILGLLNSSANATDIDNSKDKFEGVNFKMLDRSTLAEPKIKDESMVKRKKNVSGK
ncbi:hypothetical protein D3C76_1326470 [compost metagenome]